MTERADFRRSVAGLTLVLAVPACTRSAPVRDARGAPSAHGTRYHLPSDPDEAQRRRSDLVDELQHRDPTLDPKVLAILRELPRHAFAPDLSLWAAYLDRPQPIGHGQTISQPYIVALMTTALQLRPTDNVLEIGTGSGYQAAVLAKLCKTVHTIEIVAPLGEKARERLKTMGFSNVQVHIGDGYQGWPDAAPFDRIILTASPPELPPKLVEQLANGGVIVGPVGDVDVGPQVLGRWTKHGERLEFEDLGPVLFVPMVKGW